MFGVFVSFSRIFALVILIFKRLTARHLYKSFGIKRLISNKEWAADLKRNIHKLVVKTNGIQLAEIYA
jgi:hypothetical protein